MKLKAIIHNYIKYTYLPFGWINVALMIFCMVDTIKNQAQTLTKPGFVCFALVAMVLYFIDIAYVMIECVVMTIQDIITAYKKRKQEKQ